MTDDGARRHDRARACSLPDPDPARGSRSSIAIVLFGFSRVLLRDQPARRDRDGPDRWRSAIVASWPIVGAPQAGRERPLLFSMVGVVAGVAMLARGLSLLVGAARRGGRAGSPWSWRSPRPPGAAADGFASDQ